MRLKELFFLRVIRYAATLLVFVFYGTIAADALEKSDRMYVDKSERKLSLMKGNRVLKTYHVALGRNPEGPKREQGDSKTPEGHYTISLKNDRSAYHLSLRVSYPNASDRAQAKTRGVSPGGDIMIHGLPNSMSDEQIIFLRKDWTDGCIGVTKKEIEEIWSSVDVGTPIDIEP